MASLVWIFPAVICFLFWGLWGFIPKFISTENVSPYAFLLCECIGSFLVGVILLVGMKFQVDIDMKTGLIAVLAGVCGMLGVLAYYMAVSKGPFGLIAVATALYPILSIGLAYAFLGSKINVQQGIGIVLALVAIGLISSGAEDAH